MRNLLRRNLLQEGFQTLVCNLKTMLKERQVFAIQLQS